MDIAAPKAADADWRGTENRDSISSSLGIAALACLRVGEPVRRQALCS
jgi:hypothetical protein